jgi:polyribonucleotide nucleotidyltransferase
LSARMVDRPMRPLFPKSLHNDLQIVIIVLSTDREHPADILGIIGASAAVSISDIPFSGPVGASRVTFKDGEYTINPTYEEIEASDLNVTVAGIRGSIGMVEAGGQEASEEVVLEALRKAQEANDQIIDMIEEMVREVGKTKQESSPAPDTAELESRVKGILGSRLVDVVESVQMKGERVDALDALEKDVTEALAEEFDAKAVAGIFKSLLKTEVRRRILDQGVRPDGRKPTEIRPISSEVGVLPRTHGSGLFTRGQTQVLSVATLATVGMTQKLDNLSPQDKKLFMHHYNFLPFSTGETGRMFTGRREIGHGALAERAILSALPSEDEFPYAIRVVSEVLSSNGSTSMASVCGSSLALMDAGVPMKAPVAGVAMGLIMGDDGKYAVLTDIQGTEDFLGDMDFKVAGTAKGINALQMDSKLQGLDYQILKQALEQARVGRLHILDKMAETIQSHRPELSVYAPKMLRITIPVDKIGAVIGPGGRNIRAIVEETGATVDIDDKGVVVIGATSAESIEKARQRIDMMTRELEVGDIFTGRVVRLTSFGAFVQLLPGKDGLLRKEEMASMDNSVNMGDEITVMIQEIDNMGRINLSRRALFGENPSPRPAGDRGGDRGGRPFPDRGPRRGPPSGGPRGGGRGPGGGPRGDRPGPGGYRPPTPPGSGGPYRPRPQ